MCTLNTQYDIIRESIILITYIINIASYIYIYCCCATALIACLNARLHMKAWLSVYRLCLVAIDNATVMDVDVCRDSALTEHAIVNVLVCLTRSEF